MTVPLLPTPSIGNLASDLSTASAGFIQGLRAEEERRRKAALEEALLAVRAQAAAPQPELRPTDIAIPGGVRRGTIDLGTGKTFIGGVEVPPFAPESQFVSVGEVTQGPRRGELTQLATPRAGLPSLQQFAQEKQRLGLPLTPEETQALATPAAGLAVRPGQEIPLPAGQQPRDISPAVVPAETELGRVFARAPRRVGEAEFITGPGGQPLRPAALESEVVRAQAGVAMQFADGTMSEIEQRALQGDPMAFRAIDEVVNRLALQRATFRLPLIGEGLAGTIQAAEQLGLSPEGARYLAATAALISNAVPARAGKQMTINEMLLIMREFIPGAGELDKPQAWAQKIRNRKILVTSTMEAAGAGAVRFEGMEVPPPSAPVLPQMNPRFAPPRRP